MKDQVKEEAIRLTKDILDLPSDEYKPSQRAIMIVERLFALLSPKGGEPPVLGDEELKEWVVNRTGSTFLYDHEKGVLLDLIEQAKEEVADKIFEEIENSGLLISGYNSRGFLTDKTPRWQALKSKHLKG